MSRTASGRGPIAPVRPASGPLAAQYSPPGACRGEDPTITLENWCYPRVYTECMLSKYERTPHPARPAGARAQPRLRPQARLRHLLRPGQAAAVRPGVRDPRPGWPGTARSSWATPSPAPAPTASATSSPSRARPRSRRWLTEPVPPEPHLQSVLFAKVVLALMTGRAGRGVPRRQRAAHLQRHGRADRAAAHRRRGRRAAGRPRAVPPRGRPALDRPDRRPARRPGPRGDAGDAPLRRGPRRRTCPSAQTPALRGRDLSVARGRDPRRHGAERLGQVHAAALPRRHPGPAVGRDPVRRHAASTASTRTPAAPCGATSSASSSSSVSSSLS